MKTAGLVFLFGLGAFGSSVGNASGFNRVLTCTFPKGGKSVRMVVDVYSHKEITEGSDYQGFVAIKKIDPLGKKKKSGELATITLAGGEIAVRVTGKSCSDCMTLNSKGIALFKGAKENEEANCKKFLPEEEEEITIETN